MAEVVAGEGSGGSAEVKQPRTGAADLLVRLIKTKPLGFFGLIVITILLITATFAELIAPQGYNEVDVLSALQSPSWQHLMGTDNLGRDLFSRVVFGARISVFVSLGAVAVALIGGYIIGMTSAYYGGWLDHLLQRFVDGWIALPGIIVLLALSQLLPRGVATIILVIGISFAIRNSRIVRGQVLSIKERDYIKAARALGMSDVRIMLSHIMPNTFVPMLIVATGETASAILLETSLSFLGLGIPPPFPSWGGMIGGETRFYLALAPWLLIFPGLALTAVVFSWMVLGDALRDLLDPRRHGME